MDRRFGPIMNKIKVLTSTFQIVSACGSVLQIKMPSSFTKFVQFLKLFNLNIMSILPLSCTFSIDYIDYMLFSTLWPLIFAALLFISLQLLILRHRLAVAKSESKRAGYKFEKIQRKLKVRYFLVFLLLTYFILPSITTDIFAMFPCMDVNSENDGSQDRYYLVADMSISCTSDRYYFGVTYAVVFIFVYPVGIPALYFYLLYRKKDAIMQRDNPNSKRSFTVEMVFIVFH